MRLIDLYRDSNDEHVGRTLVRLARLAEAVHQHEATKIPARKDPIGVQGRDPGAVVPDGRQHAAPVHTEVDL